MFPFPPQYCFSKPSDREIPDMKKFGLIGHPISKSMSPALFKAAYGGKYTYDLIETEDFEKAFAIFREEYEGINITMPFKELACRRADVLSEECIMTGAANILLKTPEGIVAYNSDVDGVLACLQSGSADYEETVTLVVGCGGAAKAAVYAALKLGHKVVIINRTEEKAERLARAMRKYGFRCEAGPLGQLGENFAKALNIVYTVPGPVGELDKLKKKHIRGAFFKKKEKVLIEANYKNPTFTAERIAEFREANPNFRYVGGAKWLKEQGVSAYRLFTNEEPDTEAMEKVF